MRRTQKKNLTEKVIGELSRRIGEGEFAIGDKLPTEQSLCQEFGVSRTVVREAIASLRSNGRLVSRQGVGVFVREVPLAGNYDPVIQIVDIHAALRVLEFRMAIEPVAARLAAERRTADGLTRLLTAFDRLKILSTQDIVATTHADWDFHVAVAYASENDCFVESMNRYRDSILFDIEMKHQHRPQQQAEWLNHVSSVGGEHGMILSAISLGDPESAEAAMRRHLNHSLKRYRAITEGRVEPASYERMS